MSKVQYAVWQMLPIIDEAAIKRSRHPCFRIKGIVWVHDVSKTHTEMWGLIIKVLKDGSHQGYRMKISDQFSYGG